MTQGVLAILACSLLVTLAALTLAPLPAAQQPDVVVRHEADGALRFEDVPPLPVELVEAARLHASLHGARPFDWTADGGALLVGARLGETEQLHLVAAPLGELAPLSALDTPLLAARRRPGSDQVLLVLDEGGNGVHELRLLDPASGVSRALTDGAAGHAAPVWSPDGRWLAFASTRRDGVLTDVWVMDPDDPDDVRLVFEAPDGADYAPADFAPDGRSLLVTQFTSLSDTRVHVVDLAGGEVDIVAGGGLAPGHYTGITPRFSRDGGRVYLATDEAGAFRQLAVQDLETGEREILSASIEWDVEQFALSPDGKRAAVCFNVDGASELYLIETATNVLRPVPELAAALGRGVLSELVFRPDGARLALRFEAPRTPGELHVLDVVDSPKLTRWTRVAAASGDPARFVQPERVAVPTFDAVDGQNRLLPAWLSRPPGDGPFPVIVALHDGPAAQARPRFEALQQLWIAELGAAVLAPDVRGSTGYGNVFTALDDGTQRADVLRDVDALLDWIEFRPELDASRVALYGEGHGGLIALAAGVAERSRLRAVVDVAGITDLLAHVEAPPESRRDARRAEYGDEREPQARAFLEAFGPLVRAEELRLPLLVVHGDRDTRVDPAQSARLLAALRTRDRRPWALHAAEEGHGFRRRATEAALAGTTSLFFRLHLLPPRDDG